MSVLVGVETLLLVLVSLLVIGLLRSHAEILRRLEQLGSEPQSVAQHDEPRSATTPVETEAWDIGGETLDGEPVKIAVVGARRPTLLAFLSSGCISCDRFWSALANGGTDSLPAHARPVVVVKDADEESPSHLRDLAPEDVPVVMSSEAWERYRVAGSPYFILVEPEGAIAGEGTAGSWDQLASLVRDAVGDAGVEPDRLRAATPLSERGSARLARADAELEAAGIGPGHPSLYSPHSEPPDSGAPT